MFEYDEAAVDCEDASQADAVSDNADPVSDVTEGPVAQSEYDIDGDGLIDTIVVAFADGAVTSVTDTDGDSQADLTLADVDGNGIADFQVVRVGDNYTISVDADHDGVYDAERTFSRAELEQLAPTLVSDLDLRFDSNPAVVEETAPKDTPADIESDSATATLHPDPVGVVGDPDEWSDNWFEQSENGHCVPASVAQIVSEYTGQQFADESQFVALAQENGLLPTGVAVAEGMSAEDAAKLLTLSGVPAELEYSDMNGLAQAIDSGRAVMVGIDSGEYWNPAAEAGEDSAADHCVVVSGIDLQRGVVYLSDPGHPDGDQLQMPIEQFDDAWEDSGRVMIVCDQPAPQESDTTGVGLATDAIDELQSDIRTPSAVPSGIEATVDWVTAHSWVVLPVVLATGAAVARSLSN